jgi:DNA-binding NarL/FixJ family response regulator
LIQPDSQEPTPGGDLTSREREVLALLVEGLSNPQIGERLSVSRSTARAHVSNILAKLGVSNRAEAIALALRRKLVT